MTRGELQTFLQLPYGCESRDKWLELLVELLPGTRQFLGAQPKELNHPAVLSAAQIATIPLANHKNVAVIEVQVSGRVDLQRNRVGLRNLVAKLIDQHSAHAVLGFFRGDESNGDYRLSLVAKSSEISPDGELSRTETDKRRYTYILGRGQPCRTPAERLDSLRKRGGELTLDHLVEAFKVEPLFKEFFKDYGRVFDRVEGLIRPTLPEKEPLRLFTQRLFNRLMFLAFIERKGWLRFHQRTDYLAALWDARGEGESASFYSDHLIPLFFEGLNTPTRSHTAHDPRFGSVPYLNGGLFEFAEDGTDKRSDIVIPDVALDAIFSELFARYNFTVAESTPLDVEVAVDPEMLGKVFEELVTGRHEQGSYYTPKPIVSFMCREALVGHLASRCAKENRTALEAFVHDHDPAQLRDAEAVLAALRTVTVCDLACGSGAYLLGMLHELLDLRTCLFTDKKLDGRTAHERKLEIIERNLYGVDKDAFAVNIARLRLWLSLAVEYDGSQPPPALPNLDFKIEQGDSLAAPAPADVLRDAGSLPLLLPTVREFSAKKAKFLTAHGAQKETLRTEITVLKQSLKTWLATEGPADAFHWALEFAEVFLPAPAAASLSGGLNLDLELAPAAAPGGFDIVVANPPYVRQELISAQKPILRKRFKTVFSGIADLFVFFYARAHELLRDGGTAAFISSNKWLRAGYGEPLRQHLLDSQAFSLIMDFGELPVFEAAATDAAVFIWRKLPRGESSTRWAMVKDLERCYAEGVRSHFVSLSVAVPAEQFAKGKARLATHAVSEFRRRMETAGPRLSELPNLTVVNGVKTGLNDAFVINSAIKEELTSDGLDPKLINPLIVGDDVRRYELHFRDSWLLNVGWDAEINRYPALLNWLSRFRPALERRDGVKNGGHCPWYALSRPRPESQHLMERPKIVYGQIMMSPRFYMDTHGFFTNQKCFFLPTGDWFLLGILNSSVAWEFLKATSVGFGDPEAGGRLEPRAETVTALPIPKASDAERTSVGGLAERAQALHGQRRARVERFLRDLGVDPVASTSRNPLEQPWSLPPAEFAKRAKPLQRVARERPQLLYEAARDETAALTEQIAKLEAEIDSRVATLYGLDAEDQRWAAKAAPAAKPDDRSALFFRILGGLKERSPYFSLKMIQSAANDAEIAIKDEVLSVYLTQAIKQGIIQDAGRGWYSCLSKPVPLNAKPVAKLIRAVEKAFPLLDFTVWSTAQINPWMHHLLAQPVTFLHAPADTLESVGDTLRAQGWEVAVNPTPSAGPKSVRPGEKMVVLRPAMSKQPAGDGRQAPIEKILVDLIAEATRLALMDTSEAQGVATTILNQFLVQIAVLQRYADSRAIKMTEVEAINQRQSNASIGVN
jgi:hypothetical protein